MSNSQGNRRPRFMSFRRKRRNDAPQEAPTKPEEDSTETFGADENPPQWFLTYMPMFKKELIKDLLTALDNDFDEDEKRRRYKKGYFIMRSRLRAAERQLDPNSIEQGGSESDTANEAGSPSHGAPSYSDNALNNEGEIRVATRRAKRYNRKYTKKFPVIREDSLEIDDESDNSKSSSQEDEEKDDNGNTNDETPIVPTINPPTSISNEDTLNANVDEVPKEPTPFMLEPKGFIVKPSKVKTIEVNADVEKDTFYHNHNVFDEVLDNPLRLLMEYHGIDTELPETYDECDEMIREIERTRGIPNILNRRLVENRKKRQDVIIKRKKLSTPPPLPLSPLNPQSVRIILNDATSSRMPLLNQLKTLVMETEMDEDVFITEFLNKAIDVGLESKQYVHLFTYFVVQRPSMLRMRKILLKKCEAELDRHEHLYELRTAMLQHVAEAPTNEIKQRLEAELMELEKPGVFMGSTVLIGELYTHDLLSNKFFKRLIQHLLKYEEEDDLGYAAKLLKMCGKNFEFRGGDTSPYCVKLGELATTMHLDIRVSYHIATLIEYRRTGWKAAPGSWWATRNVGDAERSCESFCFSRVLDEAIANYGENFLGKFTRDIQSHFNFFETGHFVRELINAAIERPEMHQDYFEIFKKSSSLSMWVGGEDNLSNVILNEMKYFSMYFLDLAEVMPEALECFYQFVSVIIGDWGNVITTIEFCTALSGLGSPEKAREWLIKAVQATGIQNNGNNYTLSSLDCGIPRVREKENVEEETSESMEAEE